MEENLIKLEEDLQNFLGPSLREITRILSESESDGSYRVELPVDSTIDLPIEQLASLVARTSNVYGRAARFNGMAKAAEKIAKGRYERKYKKNRIGSNEAERNKNGMESAEQEQIEYTIYESIAALAEGLENASRVASESARKIFDKSNNMMMAHHREERGQYQEKDFVS